MIQSAGLSSLEVASVQPATLNQYVLILEKFNLYCLDHWMDWSTADQLDAALVAYMDYLFWHQQPSALGSKILAAVKFLIPQVSRLGSQGLPRATRASVSWGMLMPGRQRLPLPWIALAAILGDMISTNGFIAALTLLVLFRTYMRPGTSDRLRVKQLIRPTFNIGSQYANWAFNLSPSEDAIPGKTGIFDDSIVYDTDMPWIHDFFHLLTLNRQPEDLLWPIEVSAVLDLFNQSIANLKLESLQICRYSLRHGGASHDILSKHRTLIEVKRRGTWRSDNSLRRYGKEARVLDELNKIDPRVLSFGARVSENLAEVFQGTMVCPPPDLTANIPAVPKKKRRLKV